MGKSLSKLAPGELEYLRKNTHFNQKELEAWHKKFLKDFPDGRLNRKEFADFHKRFFPSGDPSEFAEYFFDAFDSDRNGEINFREFICAFSLTSRGNPDVKLKWVFQVYDMNDDGSITYDEMLQVVGSVYKLVGPMVQLPKDEDTPEKRVDKIFTLMDKDRNKELTFEEFVDGSKQDSAIAKALCLYD